jgi:hypothetical protein
LLEPFDSPDDGVDPEPREPLQLSDQLAGGGPAVVDLERERAGALDAVEVGPGAVALAAEDVELVRDLRRRAQAAGVGIARDQGQRAALAVAGDQDRRMRSLQRLGQVSSLCACT